MIPNMMLGKIKYGKITVVIFLTVLIWVWADLALDDDVTVPKATINAAFSKNIWVSFNDKAKVSINNIELKGPTSKIAEVRRRLNDGTLVLDFLLNPEREGMTTTGLHSLKVLDFIKKSEKMKIKELSGLTVEACVPEIIDVNVVELVERALDIECFDENGAPLEVASIEPSSKVDMFVPADSRLKARVELTPRDIEQARHSVVKKTPFVVLAEDQTRQASAPVEIKMPPEADSLSEYPIQEAKLGFTLSANLQGKYKVDVNYNEVVRPFTILATEEAKLAYESQPFQMTLYILDSDAQKEEQQREVVYNFPEKFVRSNEIKLNPLQKPAEARFKLIPLTSAKTPPVGLD